MSKLLLYGDPHYCAYSSVLRFRGEKYSLKIENMIKTLDWINKKAIELNCSNIICMGDFFDRPDLTAEEISSLATLNLDHHEFLIGNHEALSNNLKLSSTNIFKNSIIYDKPILKCYDNLQVVFLPYVTESERQPLKDILSNLRLDDNKKTVILSHNDIKDIQYGAFKSVQGYSNNEIMENCDLFINGHIHNGGWFNSKILNVGSLTGINFSNDADIWKSSIAILDTETLQVELILNPYSFQFYKKQFNNIDDLKSFIYDLEGNLNIISMKLPEKIVEEAHKLLIDDKILYKRIIIDYQTVSKVQEEVIDTRIDYFEKFKQFILEKYNDGLTNINLMVEEISALAAKG